MKIKLTELKISNIKEANKYNSHYTIFDSSIRRCKIFKKKTYTGIIFVIKIKTLNS